MRLLPGAGAHLRGHGGGGGQRRGVQFIGQGLAAALILLQRLRACARQVIERHQAGVRRLVPGFKAQKLFRGGDGAGEIATAVMEVCQLLQSLHGAVTGVQPRGLAPVIQKIGQQITAIERDGRLQGVHSSLRGGRWRDCVQKILEALHVHVEGSPRVELHRAAFNQYQFLGCGQRFQRAAQAVQILPQIAPRGRLRRIGPEEERKLAAVTRLGAVQQEVGKERARGGRAEIERRCAQGRRDDRQVAEEPNLGKRNRRGPVRDRWCGAIRLMW